MGRELEAAPEKGGRRLGGRSLGSVEGPCYQSLQRR